MDKLAFPVMFVEDTVHCIVEWLTTSAENVKILRTYNFGMY